MQLATSDHCPSKVGGQCHDDDDDDDADDDDDDEKCKSEDMHGDENEDEGTVGREGWQRYWFIRLHLKNKQDW